MRTPRDEHARLIATRSTAPRGVWSRLAARARVLLGPAEIRTPEGVRYRARRSASAALAGETVEYDVDFAPPPSGPGGSMRIRPTAARVYADLSPSPRLGVLEMLAPPAAAAITPGQRVLELGCGTGEAASELARLVGPTGGVVAIDADRESIRFARRRYPAPNISFEIGGAELLAGELDGAFDAAMLSVWPPELALDAGSAAEVWRVVRPGGRLVVGVALERARDAAAALAAALGVGAEGVAAFEAAVGPSRAGLVVVRAATGP